MFAAIRRAIAPGTSLGSLYRKTLRYCKIGSALFSVPSAIFTAGVLAQPKVSVEAKDYPAKNYITNGTDIVFFVKNEGHVPIYNLGSSCDFDGSLSWSFDRITLSAGKTTTVRCGFSSKKDDVKLKLKIKYQWLFHTIRAEENFEFEPVFGKDSKIIILLPQGDRPYLK